MRFLPLKDVTLTVRVAVKDHVIVAAGDLLDRTFCEVWSIYTPEYVKTGRRFKKITITHVHYVSQEKYSWERLLCLWPSPVLSTVRLQVLHLGSMFVWDMKYKWVNLTSSSAPIIVNTADRRRRRSGQHAENTDAIVLFLQDFSFLLGAKKLIYAVIYVWCCVVRVTVMMMILLRFRRESCGNVELQSLGQTCSQRVSNIYPLLLLKSELIFSIERIR